MTELQDIVGSFTPLTRKGSEWHGACPIEAHAEPLAVIDGRIKCFGCGFTGGALEFLLAVGEPDAEHALENGRIWTPTLIQPTPPPPKWGLHRIRDDGRTILITDHRAAAKVADALLPSYCVVAWPDGGDRWGELEPLRDRLVLLWPSPGGEEAMRRLEAVITGPLNAGGKMIEPQDFDLAAYTGTQDELIKWAKAHVRLLARTEAVAQVPASEAGGNVVADTKSSPVSPPPAATAPDTPESPVESAEPSEPPTAEFPPEASLTRPKRPRRRLQVVGGAALDALESIDPEAAPIPHELSESGIAAHFVAMHKDKFRTVHEWSGKQGACWMAWDGSRWRREPSRVTAMQQAQLLAHGVKYWDAARAVAELSKVKFESRKFIGAFLDLASYAPEFVASPSMFDASPMLLGTPGGTVDLTTGKLCEPDPAQFLTRQTAVTPCKGPHPLFDNVIERLCVGDDSMRGYIMRALGYSICADQREEVFWFLHGKPLSGKSTLVKTIAEILGNAEDGGYAATFDMELFTEQRNDKGSERMAHLHGARFAWASETEEGKNFKTALLKLATGGDKLSGRFLYQEKFSFEPTHHLWLFGNERIHLKSADAGIKRRLHMIEYPGVIAEDERDNTLKERLKEEYPAILHSMIMGCLDWQLCGALGKPDQISIAVNNYMDSEDEVSAWLDECVDRGPQRTPVGDAFRSFSAWAEKNGAFLISAKRFSGELEKRGFERTRTGGIRYVSGFTLKTGANL